MSRCAMTSTMPDPVCEIAASSFRTDKRFGDQCERRSSERAANASIAEVPRRDVHERLTNQGNRRAATGARRVEDMYRRVRVDRRVRRQAGVRCAQRAAERAEHGDRHWRFGLHDASCVRLRENARVCNTAHDRGRALSHDSLGERLRKNGNAGIAASAESQSRFAKRCRTKVADFSEGTLLATRTTKAASPGTSPQIRASPEKRRMAQPERVSRKRNCRTSQDRRPCPGSAERGEPGLTKS